MLKLIEQVNRFEIPAALHRELAVAGMGRPDAEDGLGGNLMDHMENSRAPHNLRFCGIKHNFAPITNDNWKISTRNVLVQSELSSAFGATMRRQAPERIAALHAAQSEVRNGKRVGVEVHALMVPWAVVRALAT